ncbi:MAG: AbrB/MazE/SpoVT family DNA-binding domain-containing protein [Betaproteobacteria bacterium]|nr:AbrB/MazE/SpoVT family DNA-binding domain-containing protein [Betaproteobacteria bacterium]
MLAKLTSKNQLTLPKTVVEQVRAEYYSVRTEGQSIVLTPVKLGGLEAVQEKLAALGIVERDVKSAVTWARKQKRSTKSKS